MVQIPIASGDFPGLIFEDWMLIVKKHIIAAAVLCTLASGAALAQQAQKTEGPWMVRARAVYVDTYNSTSGVATALDLNVDSKWIPEVDISYFFNKNVAAELILTWPQKMTVNAGNTSIGSIKVLPPTLLLQYHFDGLPVKPYVGAGINYTNFSGVSLPAGVTINNSSWGGALQAGVDIPLKDNMYLNLDLKKVWMGTDVYVGGVNSGSLNVNPLLMGVGLGWRF